MCLMATPKLSGAPKSQKRYHASCRRTKNDEFFSGTHLVFIIRLPRCRWVEMLQNDAEFYKYGIRAIGNSAVISYYICEKRYSFYCILGILVSPFSSLLNF